MKVRYRERFDMKGVRYREVRLYHIKLSFLDGSEKKSSYKYCSGAFFLMIPIKVCLYYILIQYVDNLSDNFYFFSENSYIIDFPPPSFTMRRGNYQYQISNFSVMTLAKKSPRCVLEDPKCF